MGFVKVAHDDEITSLYAHNSWLFVSVGDSVEMGEVIALSGNSGRSTAPHLHRRDRARGPVCGSARLSCGRDLRTGRARGDPGGR